MYGVGRYGWMLLVGELVISRLGVLLYLPLARLLVGLFQGSLNVVFRSYIGETSEIMISMLPEDKRAKSTIKYSGFFIVFITGTISMVLLSGNYQLY